MFGIGFLEIVVIAVAALVIVGPKKLPELMRQAGKLFVHVRRTTNDVRSTFDQVIKEAEDDLRRKEIEDLKNILAPKPAVVEAEVKPVDDVNPSHSDSPEGSLHYDPHHDDGHRHSDDHDKSGAESAQPANDHPGNIDRSGEPK